ncbi:MAG: hypothetical protein AAFX03_13560 [Pseudomonadota bacterium]
MTQAARIDIRAPIFSGAFALALGANMIWINASEVWRYFMIVKPMLHEAFPGDAGVAAVTPAIFASWMVWDTILILAATGFYWMFLERNGASVRQALLAATALSVTIFGLIWLGIANMGLVPARFIWAALPLAWAEQAIAALIVLWTMKRA